MSSRNVKAIVVAIACVSLFTGCQKSAPPRATLTADALMTSNGIAENGIAENGIAENGIAENGLTNGMVTGTGTNGLAANGLTTAAFDAPEFQAWFAIDTAYSDMVMKYFVKCALADGASLAFSYGGVDYSWPGVFGLAPRWTAGEPIPEEEQQLVTACVAGHVNGLGQHVTISVRGYRTTDETIPLADGEEAGWPFAEACYFGNLFSGGGIYDALMPDSLQEKVSTPRGCAAEFGKPGSCPPMAQVGMCADVCTLGPDGKTWASCTAPDGTVYRPVQVFLRPSDVYQCGDGVCQSLTENETTCPEDCKPAPVCGDAVCNGAETNATCPQDGPAVCGDGVCNGTETNATCPQDCPAVCGDGVCNGTETDLTCPQDCPQPASTSTQTPSTSDSSTSTTTTQSSTSATDPAPSDPSSTTTP